MLANEEQRDFNRMQINTTAHLAKGDQQIEGVCRNLSALGALMEVPSGQCQVGEQWQLVMPGANAQVPPLKANAEVIRVDNQGSQDLVGLSLTQVR
ncbi:PilZ domain-containing protein [Oceanisphaera avium]|nr:PilZ domain-containing protein [Oceanisphaera avium]